MTSLQERVAEAVEYERKLKLHRDSTNLERLLLQAKVVATKLAPVQIQVDKQNNIRFDLDGVAFSVYSYLDTQCDDQGDPIGEKEIVRLTAHKICSREGCTRTRHYPRVDNVTKLSDLNALYAPAPRNSWRHEDPECGLGDRHGQEHSMETDGIEDDELQDLPF